MPAVATRDPRPELPGILIRVVAALLPLVLSAGAAGQTSQGGVPVSELQLLPGVVPTVSPEPVIVDDYLAEDALAEPNAPFRFGATLPVDFGFDQGLWTQLPDGDRVWRLRIESPGAHSLGLLFSEYTLPGGSRLFVYDDAYDVVVGAFDDRNNKVDGQFAIAPVPGDAITLEYVEPAPITATGQHARLRLGAVVHDYRDLYRLTADSGRPGASAPCEVDVNCPPGEPWQHEKRAVTLIIIGGTVCTGSLINNAAHDGSQYFIAAHHCGNLNNALFGFGFENTGCSGGGVHGPMFVQGSTQLAGNAYIWIDFRLVEITSPIPASYSPFYLGWDRSGAVPASTVTIHHPFGDVKKLSVDSNSPKKNEQGWEVIEWELGINEPGSSGCPLLDPQGRFIGQHYGGLSTCESPKHDAFRRLDEYWDEVKPWLDPSDTGVVAIDGFDPFPGTPPRLDAVLPWRVQAFQGGMLTLSGSNFLGAAFVTVGDVAVPQEGFTIVDANTITLPAPVASALGETKIRVSSGQGMSEQRIFGYVETNPPKLATPSKVFGGTPWDLEWGAGSLDTALLLYSLSPDTVVHDGVPVLSHSGIGMVQTLGPTGIGGLSITVPAGSIGTIYTQIVTLNAVGGFAGASDVQSTLVFP